VGIGKDTGMSLKSFLTRLILICVLPLVLLAAYLAVDRVQSLQTQRDIEAANLARNIATALDRQVEARISALQVLAASSSLDDPRRLGELYQEAQDFRKNFGGHVVLADSARQMIFLTSAPLGKTLPKLPRVKGNSAAEIASLTGKPAVGDVFIGSVLKVPLVAMAVPVFRAGRMSHLMLSVIETGKVQQRLDDLAIPPGWSMTVLDGKNEVIARRGPPQPADRPAGDAPPGRFKVKSSLSPWSVLLEVPPHLHRAPVIAATTAMMATLLAATMVSVLGGIWAGRRLAGSVAALEQPHLVPDRQLAIHEIEAVRCRLLSAAAARQAAESTLRESEERYRSLVENAPMAIFVNRSDSIEYANPAALRLFGADAGQLLGRSPFQFVHPDFHCGMAERIQRLSRERSTPLTEVRIVQPGSVERNVEVVATAFTDHKGAAIQVMMHDITERKKAEEVARLSTERLLRAEAIAHLGHWRYDLGSDELFCSDEAYRVLGAATRQPAAGPAAYLQLVCPEERAGAADAMARLLREGKLDFDCRITRPDGELRHVTLTGELQRDGEGAAAAMFGTIMDTTRLKQQERELQEKNVELERFTYMVSHDLRSPLVTVKTFLGYLEQDMASGNAGRISQDIGYMRGAAEKMGHLLDDLLEMTRIGRVVNAPVQVSFIELVQSALALVAGSIAERGVQVQLQPRELTLFGDAPRLVEIWQNLLDNAVKFSAAEQTPCIEVGAEGEGRETVFYLRDNGIGIDPRFCQKIFGLFDKLDQRTPGTGLGLAIIKRIIELYQGRIWVESAGVGHGSCFRFTLPDAFRPN